MMVRISRSRYYFSRTLEGRLRFPRLLPIRHALAAGVEPFLGDVDADAAAQVALLVPLPFLDRRLLQRFHDLGLQGTIELPNGLVRVLAAVVLTKRPAAPPFWKPG